MQGIYHHHEGDSAATVSGDALASELLKGKDSVFQNYSMGSNCHKNLWSK